MQSMTVHAREVREDRIANTLDVITGHFTDIFVKFVGEDGLSIARNSFVEVTDARIGGEIPFDYLLAAAHERGIRVRAEISPGIWPGYLQAVVPMPAEWNCRSLDGIEEDWLNFSVSEARSFVADVAEELCDLYPALDGISLDHIRYRPGWLSRPEFSAADITESVRLVKDAVRVKLSAYVGATEERALYVGQHWWDWLDEDLVDWIVSGTYRYPDEFPATLDALLGIHGPDRLSASIHVMPDNVDTPLTEEEFLWEVGAIEERGFEGWNLFSLSCLRKTASHLIPVLPEIRRGCVPVVFRLG